MKIKKNLFGLLGAAALAVAASGCADQKITFHGTVYSGTLDPATDMITVGSPISGATVREKNNTPTALTDAAGKYTLEVEVPGVIGYPNAKAYTIESTYRGGGDDDIVYARPGERIYVRDMVIYQIVPNITQ